MAEFDDTELRRLDLTLLLVFEEAMASRKLSAAAQRLGLTQSAISHALKRLRHIFGDELFIRTPRGVQPTPRALALRAPLAEALRLLAGAVRPARFDPQATDRVFRIAAPDYETALFAPLLAATGTAGPRFVFQPLIRREAVEALAATEIDLALGYTWDRGSGCDAETLFEDDYLVVARIGHPALEQPLDLSRYASFRHVLAAPGGSLAGVVDRVLAAEGRARRVAVAVPYFLAALATVARTELIATVPRRIALCHAASFGLGTATPPVPIRRFAVRMTWNRRLGTDPAISWLRERVADAAGRLAA
ncbi:MAG: LysR family transcriptional regulator [Acetobacteraceae bacterium]|nr:LysR family transcriptional regulator [Acetobacteraceae bacterium]